MARMNLIKLAEEIKALKQVRESTYDNWMKALKPIQSKDFYEIDKVEVRKYIIKMRQPSGPWNNNTMATRLNSLQGLWHAAMEWEYVKYQRNPWKGAKSVLNLTKKSQRRNPKFHPWEFYAPFHDDPYFICMWYCGCRLHEIAGIYKENIVKDAPIPYYDFKHQKNRLLKNDESIRQVPIHPEALKVVDDLFFSKAISPGKAWSEKFHQVLELPDGEAAHTLRHNLTTRFNRMNVTETVKNSILGHDTPGHGADYGEVELETKDKIIRLL